MSSPDIGSLLSGLSDEDFAALSDMAQQLLGSGEEKKEAKEPQPDLFGGMDADMLAKLMRILPMLQSSGDDERARLICALKPLLSEPRRRRADEALKLMHLMDIMPLLGEISL